MNTGIRIICENCGHEGYISLFNLKSKSIKCKSCGKKYDTYMVINRNLFSKIISIENMVLELEREIKNNVTSNSVLDNVYEITTGIREELFECKSLLNNINNFIFIYTDKVKELKEKLEDIISYASELEEINDSLVEEYSKLEEELNKYKKVDNVTEF